MSKVLPSGTKVSLQKRIASVSGHKTSEIKIDGIAKTRKVAGAGRIKKWPRWCTDTICKTVCCDPRHRLIIGLSDDGLEVSHLLPQLISVLDKDTDGCLVIIDLLQCGSMV